MPSRTTILIGTGVILVAILLLIKRKSVAYHVKWQYYNGKDQLNDKLTVFRNRRAQKKYHGKMMQRKRKITSERLNWEKLQGYNQVRTFRTKLQARREMRKLRKINKSMYVDSGGFTVKQWKEMRERNPVDYKIVKYFDTANGKPHVVLFDKKGKPKKKKRKR